MVKERGLGYPRTDVERAISHYGISEDEYYANPEAYSLPDRGTGLETGSAAGSNPGTGVGLGTVAVVLFLLWAIFRRK